MLVVSQYLSCFHVPRFPSPCDQIKIHKKPSIYESRVVKKFFEQHDDPDTTSGISNYLQQVQQYAIKPLPTRSPSHCLENSEDMFAKIRAGYKWNESKACTIGRQC